MTWFITVVALIVGFALAVAWFVNAEPRQVLRMLRWVGLGLALVLALIVIFTGRFQLILAVLAFLVPWLFRLRAMRTAAKAARGPAGGQTSEVRTRFVVMQLNHDTGEMDGRVQEGPHAGHQLSDMPLAAVLDLLRAAAAADQESAQVLQAYLDRMHGDSWREGTAGVGGEEAGYDQAGGTAGGQMDRDEAFAILGLSPGATEQEIKRAHRRLMQQFHPDHGGSDYLAARINEAKEVLLSER